MATLYLLLQCSNYLTGGEGVTFLGEYDLEGQVEEEVTELTPE